VRRLLLRRLLYGIKVGTVWPSLPDDLEQFKRVAEGRAGSQGPMSDIDRFQTWQRDTLAARDERRDAVVGPSGCPLWHRRDHRERLGHSHHDGGRIRNAQGIAKLRSTFKSTRSSSDSSTTRRFPKSVSGSRRGPEAGGADSLMFAGLKASSLSDSEEVDHTPLYGPLTAGGVTPCVAWRPTEIPMKTGGWGTDGGEIDARRLR